MKRSYTTKTLPLWCLIGVLAACQPSGDTSAGAKAPPTQTASTPAAWAETFPVYPILHDKTIEKDLWEFTHAAINECGTESQTVKIWAVRKMFSDGKSSPDLVLVNPSKAVPAEVFRRDGVAYIECAKAVAERISD